VERAPAERAADEYDPIGVDLGHARDELEHAGHDMLPVRTLRHTTSSVKPKSAHGA
jgi:hypothetical protein